MLIRIGDKIINTDHIVKAVYDGEPRRVSLRLSGDEITGRATTLTTFDGPEAQALWGALTLHAVELDAGQPDGVKRSHYTPW
jgi:hypothetical protein